MTDDSNRQRSNEEESLKALETTMSSPCHAKDFLLLVADVLDGSIANEICTFLGTADPILSCANMRQIFTYIRIATDASRPTDDNRLSHARSMQRYQFTMIMVTALQQALLIQQNQSLLAQRKSPIQKITDQTHTGVTGSGEFTAIEWTNNAGVDFL